MMNSLLRRRVRGVSSGGGAGGDVPVTLHRIAAGTASTVVTGGVALPAGALMPGGVARLEIGGAEIPAAYADSGLRHSDGSVSWLRIQTTRTLSHGSPESATLRCGVAPSSAVSFAPIVWPTGTSAATWQTLVPVPGLCMNSSAATMCAAWPVAPLQPRSNDAAISAVTAYNTAFDETWSAAFTGWDGNTLNQSAGQYDRPYLLSCVAARTADVAWMARAAAMYARLRDSYWVPGNWQIPEWLTNSDSWMLFDAWFGDTGWRTAMLTGEDYLVSWFPGFFGSAQLAAGAVDARQVSARLRVLLNLRRLGLGASMIRQAAYPAQSVSVDTLLADLLTRSLNAPNWTNAGGRYVVNTSDPFSFHFHQAILCQVFAECADAGVGTTATLRARVQAVMDWMWANARTPSANAFFGGDASPAQATAIGDDTPTAVSRPDIEGFWPTLAGHLFRWGVGGTTWRDRGDQMLAVIGRTPRSGSPAEGPYLSGLPTNSQKQWNEAFHRGQHYLALRS